MKVAIKAPQEEKDRHIVKADQQIQQIAALTPDQAAAYVDRQVVDLASAKRILKVLTKIVIYLLRRKLNALQGV